MVRKGWRLLLLVSLVFLLGACQGQKGQQKVLIGSKASDAEIWRYIAKSDAAQEAGFEIEVKDFVEGPVLNTATAEGEVDVNAFQNFAYMNSFNQEQGDSLVALGSTYFEPMGLYSANLDKLEDLDQGAHIGLADYPSDQSRALLLLQAAGLIELSDEEKSLYSVDDIQANPKQLNFDVMNENTLPRSLTDLDAACIGNTIAMEAGLDLEEDTIYKESVNDDTLGSVNILAVAKDHPNKEALKKLLDLYHSEDVQNFVKEKFKGTKQPVKLDQEEIKAASQYEK
ncbi:MetQ/NlpA family ABC transporter substrate-binding protein [Aerococcus sp. UMB10185]|uniref:MetQ/NlpA family ABC transporter substrate-binding protein n=1 Tax=unclassified Aerococcus TaxID=2618060 RepID=UPI0008A21E3E|nr:MULTISPECIES: MetQ/NlpA family ABC transporter substrate-binding protein [unclassified Aerococcus]MDK6232697.1 MetQ/NlpA family ABC transporter substrate-binding protein [Aerococcus sp. UMB10185]MDK6855013.1 MetQ/NlpA family ABC transporter substrate-binding protein [Aerococcus sp. UMB7533]MDK8501721.1 MetQ/NlpA family ABC transporter substrate-binding protein [Aerococcus sp. UMB1112A]